MQRHDISRGDSRPLGATVRDGGVNFSLYSEHAERVELLLFTHFNDQAPFQVIRLETRHHRIFNYWHVFVHGIGAGQVYGYRVFGPNAPEQGLRYDHRKVLLDPYAKGIVYGQNWCRANAQLPFDNTRSAMKSLVVDHTTFDWGDVVPPEYAPTDRIIYETHVRGFTKHPSSGVAHPGTFQGLIEKIPYLKELGVTTVELLPVFQFDQRCGLFTNPETLEHLRDYWGYNPLGFFAPHRGYYIEDWGEMRYLTGFRDLVKALHAEGLEVFLDVVFNHTAEGGDGGPTISYRGIENPAYYHLDPDDPAHYADYSGCGNTLNCNHPIVRRLILDSLRYWAEVMHVDGFRFDLASILSRDEQGRPLEAPPLTWEIECDPLLQNTSLIAEAWDAAGLYQVGAFPGERWSEWNGHFRDDVRRFVRGDLGLSGLVATRMMGSPDLYEHHGREPYQCVNFVTCHDGFTMNDLVTFTEKRNLANGEQNRDGCDDNLSDNCGVEGPTDDPEITALRRRQARNMMAILFLSQGTPMILAGDEFLRTQGGNNNAWCQDNATSWVDWALLEENADMFRFVRGLIAFRKAHPSLRRDEYLLGTDAPIEWDIEGYTRVQWHGIEPGHPDWRYECRTLSFTLTEAADDCAIHVIVNMHTEPICFRLPLAPQESRWMRVIDTAVPAPADLLEPGSEVSVDSPYYTAQGRSVVVLCSHLPRG